MTRIQRLSIIAALLAIAMAACTSSMPPSTISTSGIHTDSTCRLTVSYNGMTLAYPFTAASCARLPYGAFSIRVEGDSAVVDSFMVHDAKVVIKPGGP